MSPCVEIRDGNLLNCKLFPSRREIPLEFPIHLGCASMSYLATIYLSKPFPDKAKKILVSAESSIFLILAY